MPLNTLQERCHLAITSGDISNLHTEVVNSYNSGILELIWGNKLIRELCKRKYVNFNNPTCGLDYLPTTITPASGEFWEWEDGNTLLWENGIEMETE